MTPTADTGHAWLVVGLVSLVLAAFFVWFAGVDLWFSGFFWTTTDGWFLGNTWWAMLMYKTIPILVYVVALAIPVVAIINAVRKRPLGPFRGRALVYIFCAIAIGPGLVVNVVFKDQWGRARPRDVTEFGGTKTFTPAFVISDQCPKNCSFVAGHPSMAFALVSLVLVAARRRRSALIATVLVFGVLVGFGRIVQGGHFLSDVVFSAIFTLVIAVALFGAFRLEPPGGSEPGPPPPPTS